MMNHSTQPASLTRLMLQRTSDCSASIRARASLCVSGGHNDRQNEKRGQVSNGGTGHPIATPKDNCSSETTKHTTNAKQCNSLFQEAFPWSLGSGPQGLQTLELWHQPWLLVTHVPRKCILGVQVRLLERSSKQNPILSWELPLCSIQFVKQLGASAASAASIHKRHPKSSYWSPGRTTGHPPQGQVKKLSTCRRHRFCSEGNPTYRYL